MYKSDSNQVTSPENQINAQAEYETFSQANIGKSSGYDTINSWFNNV